MKSVEVLGFLTLTLHENILATCLAQSPKGKSNFLSFPLFTALGKRIPGISFGSMSSWWHPHCRPAGVEEDARSPPGRCLRV